MTTAAELVAFLADPSTPHAAEAARQALDLLPRLEAELAGVTASRDSLAAELAEARRQLEAPVTAPATPAGAMPGTRALESFPGASDEDRLTEAIGFVSRSSYKPSIMLPLHRKAGPFTRTRDVLPGFRLIGPPVVGMQNVEQGGGVLNPTRVVVNTGTHDNSWWVGRGGRPFNFGLRDFCVESTNGTTQILHFPVSRGTLFGCTFHNMGFQAVKHVLGNPDEPLSVTLCSFTGDWVMTTAKGRQVDLAGSDCLSVFTTGICNIGPAGNNSTPGRGEHLVCLRLSKSNIGNLYITCDDGFRALKLQGDSRYQMGNTLTGLVLEGRNKDDAADGALVTVTGGGWDLYGVNLNYAMKTPGADRGYIHQTGGDLHVWGATVDRATGVSEDVPILHIAGGEAIVRGVKRGTKSGGWARRPRIVQTRAGLVVDSDATTRLDVAA